MKRLGFICVAWAVATTAKLVYISTAEAALVIEPVINRVEGSGPADNNFPIYDPSFLIDGAAYFTADEPGEIITYASGDPRDPFLDVFHVWNNTRYDITGLTLELIGTATDTANPGTIIRGPVDATWGDVNGDSQTGLSDIFATIVVSPDGKEIRFEDGVIPVGGRFTDIHLAMSDSPPDFGGIDSSFTGILVPEPTALALIALAALGHFLTHDFRKCRWAKTHRDSVATSFVLLLSAGHASAAIFNVNDVAELISAIHSANQNTEPDSIALAAGATFTISEANDFTNGINGLPTISASGELAIFGNGGVIERSTDSAAPGFRLLNVAAGASLTLEDVTLRGGYSPFGGAIYNAGTLALAGVTVQNNLAWGNRGANCRCRPGGNGGPGGPGLGGGIYSEGSLLLGNSALFGNLARGGSGGSGSPPGGRQGRDGDGLGGGLYVAAGTAALHNSFLSGNSALGGSGSSSGHGYGGGIYIADAQVGIDEFTVAHVTGNTATTSDPNIAGTYELLPNPLPGDLDLDGDVDLDDIDDFALGLNDAAAYEDLFGVLPFLAGDTDGDGDQDFDDIDDFVAILTSPDSGVTQAVPEPCAAALFGVAIGTLALCRLRPSDLQRVC
jgi:hypothetical protein